MPVLDNEDKSRWVFLPTSRHLIKSSVTHPIVSFVINADDGKDTAPVVRNDVPLPAAQASSHAVQEGDESQVFWIVASAKEARCFANITSDRISKVDWNAPVQHIEIVRRPGESLYMNPAASSERLIALLLAGSLALVGFTNNREALVYSIPGLELLHSLHLPEGPPR